VLAVTASDLVVVALLSFGRLLLVAVGLSVVESVVGLYLSFYGNWASGATIVLVETAVFGLGLALSPRRGVLVGRPVRQRMPSGWTSVARGPISHFWPYLIASAHGARLAVSGQRGLSRDGRPVLSWIAVKRE
jgi:hypothetical protein